MDADIAWHIGEAARLEALGDTEGADLCKEYAALAKARVDAKGDDLVEAKHALREFRQTWRTIAGRN